MEGRKRKEKRKGREGGEKRHLKQAAHQVLDSTLVTLTSHSTLQYFGSKQPAVSGYI